MLLASFLLGAACTTLEPVGPSPDEIRESIYAGDVLYRGVRIVTTDGGTHRFRVLEVDSEAGVVRGKTQEVSVAEIASLQRRVFAPAMTGGAVMFVMMVLFSVPL